MSLKDIDSGKAGPITKAQAMANKEGMKLIKPSKNINNNVFYNGVSGKTAKAVNATIKKYNETFNGKQINKIYAPVKGSRLAESMKNTADMSFDVNDRILAINPYNCGTPEQTARKLKEEQNIVNAFINNPSYITEIKDANKQKALINSLISGRVKVEESLEELAWHEIAHGMEEEIKGHELWNKAKEKMDTTAPYISGYACQNEDEYITQVNPLKRKTKK